MHPAETAGNAGACQQEQQPRAKRHAHPQPLTPPPQRQVRDHTFLSRLPQLTTITSRHILPIRRCRRNSRKNNEPAHGHLSLLPPTAEHVALTSQFKESPPIPRSRTRSNSSFSICTAKRPVESLNCWRILAMEQRNRLRLDAQLALNTASLPHRGRDLQIVVERVT